MNVMKQSKNAYENNAMNKLRGLVTKALDDRREEKLLELRGQRRQRQVSVTAVFEMTSSSREKLLDSMKNKGLTYVKESA